MRNEKKETFLALMQFPKGSHEGEKGCQRLGLALLLQTPSLQFVPTVAVPNML